MSDAVFELSTKEAAAWRECGASETELGWISAAGGFQAISESPDKQLRLQDVLDHLLGSRLVAVRNALRDLGWDGEQFAGLQKEIDGSTFSFMHKTKNVGAGRNVAGVSYMFFKFDANTYSDLTKVEVVDDMSMPAVEMARSIERSIIHKHGLKASAYDVAAIRQAIPETDGPYGIGVRDALESVVLALESARVDATVIGVAIETALDAYANNDEPVSLDAATAFCAKVARMSEYPDGDDAATTMNNLIRSARIILGQEVDRIDAELSPFTVIGNYADNGQLFAAHVMAKNPTHAFFVLSASGDGAEREYAVAIPGHLKEGTHFEMPGESVVCSSTVLEQPDVFGEEGEEMEDPEARPLRP